MFSTEIDHDEVKITLMDDGGFYEDVRIAIYDDIVTIKQYDEDLNIDIQINLSPDMFTDIMEAMKKPEGLYRTK